MRKKVVWEPHEIGLLIVAGILALFSFFAPKAMGATVYYPVIQSHTDIDTLKVIIKERSGDFDSTTYEWTSIPVKDSIPLTIGKHYDLMFSYFWAGEPQWLEDPAIPFYVQPDNPFSNVNIRYVDADAGTGGDGLTWSTAFDHPDDISTITTGTNYLIYIDADDYDPVDGCSLQVDYMSLVGVNGTPLFHYNTDTFSNGTWDSTAHQDVSECIYINNQNWSVENIRFTGEGLYAYPEYAADPDGNLSTAYRGGKNAIFIDTGGDFGQINNCFFDSCYKPIVAYYVEDSLRTAAWGVTIENCIFRDVEYHAIDAALAYSVIRNNTFIKTNVSDHPAAGAIQLISSIGAYNMIYNNYLHGYGYGLYANESDSNFFANNWLGSEIISDGTGDAIRSYSTTVDAINNFFVDNQRLGAYMPEEGEGNLIKNSGFEYPTENIRHVPFWGSNDWDATRAGYGASIQVSPFGFVNSAVDESDGSSSGKLGHSLFMMAGNTDAYIHQNTNVFRLDAGEAQFSMKVLPNSPIVSGDTVRVLLYEDTNYDGTFSAFTSEVYYFLSGGGTTWENVSHMFTISNPGNYYMSISTFGVDSGDGFYYDDVFFGQYAGNVVASASITTGDKEDIAQLVKDTADVYPNTFYGPSATGTGSDTIVFYAIDTLGDDSARNDVLITVIDSTGSDVIFGRTSGNGNITFFLDPDGYSVNAYSRGYGYNSRSYTVAGNDDSVDVTGYNLVTVLTSPSNTSLCRVYGNIYDALNLPAKYATVYFETNEIFNICDSTIIIGKPKYEKMTNDSGYFFIDLLKTSCMRGTRTWRVHAEYEDGNGNLIQTRYHDFAIPDDSSTYRLVF